jgi:hypothetical protein
MFKLNQVMANFLDIVKSKSTPEVVNKPINQLTASEIEFLLSLIKNANFKGEQLEIIYNIVLKLQDQYIGLNKK